MRVYIDGAAALFFLCLARGSSAREIRYGERICVCVCVCVCVCMDSSEWV